MMGTPESPKILPIRGIDSIAVPQSNDPKPIEPIEPAEVISVPQKSEDISAVVQSGVGSPDNRREATDANRPRTLVTQINANIDANRVALITLDGPPFRGKIDTDLAIGSYSIKADKRAQLWVFDTNQVKSGLRFTIWLDGPDPFALDYSTHLLVTISNGIDSPKNLDLKGILSRISRAVSDQKHVQALALLCELGEVDLYDVLDELWNAEPGVLNDILLKFEKSMQVDSSVASPSVLRALESFSRPPKEVFVDSFDTCTVYPKSFSKNEERALAGLTNIQLLLNFNLTPPRSLIVYADDILESAVPAARLPKYGPGCLTYPDFLSKGTTPRLYEAKKNSIKEIEKQNSEFIAEAFKQSANILLSVYSASLSIAKIQSAKVSRGLTSKSERGPGVWRSTFEGGSNMSESAAEYELNSCGTPKGLGYFVDNVQFEGFKNGRLLDAKAWEDGGRLAQALRRQEFWAGAKVVEQARRQLLVASAHGVEVEWRFIGKEAAEIVREIFRVNGLPVHVVFIP